MITLQSRTSASPQSRTIGIDITSAIMQGGGIGRYTRELTHALLALDGENQYRFFSAKPLPEPPVKDAVPTAVNAAYHPSRLNERWLYRLWYRLRLPLPVQWNTGKLDLFHSPDFVLPPTSGNIPTVLTIHDLSFAHYPDTFPASLVSYLNSVVPRSIKQATHLLADSLSTKRDLLHLWNVPEEKVTVLYAGVDGRFQPVYDAERVTAVRRQYNIPATPYILCVGTVQPRKNYPMLIRAFAPLVKELPHNLIIAGGKGWLNEELMGEIERQGIGGRVHFTGFVADADLPALYSGAELLAFPSLYEGFGLPLLEAMACKTAVLTSNASSLPEVAGDAAIQLPPDDEYAWTTELHRLLTDSDARQQLVQKGVQQSARFRWKTAARQLKTIYEEMIDG